jgi:hypothetical protein
MSDHGLRAVSVNLGCGGPRAADYREGVMRWTHTAAGRFDVVFAQEMPADADWASIWSEYVIVESPGRPFRPRSAVLVRRGLGAEPFDYGTADYHGSYVAAAVVRNLVLMSVHASPNEVSEQWRTEWCQDGRVLPDEYRGALWDSDLVVETVRANAKRHPLLACGDWNEARNWDLNHSGESGKAFFGRLKSLGLKDACCETGADAPATHGELCLDHVVASEPVAAAITFGRVIDREEWPADHRPVEFTIGV